MVQTKIKGKSILVVEDEPVIAKVCTRTLSAEGFQVEIVVNGKLALDVLKKKKFDLCLIDIRTPEMNGTELYHHMEKEHPDMTSKVVFTTGDVMDTSLKAFLQKSKRPYMAKPFTPDELRAVVKKSLGLN